MIFVNRDAGLIPLVLLEKAIEAQKALEALPPEQREDFIRNKSDIWRAFKDCLAQMSYGKCWYSESPEVQSFLDVDHYRPKLEAKRSDTEIDLGYPWLAFSWENFRLSAQRSNRLSTNEDTDETEGKGSWFPLIDGSPKACWDDRCEEQEQPLLLDPAKARDVRLIDVQADGRMGPSRYCHGANQKRVEASIKFLGLDLPKLKEARLRIMREMKAQSDVLLSTLENSAQSSEFADKAALDGMIFALREKTHPREPYVAAARSQLRMMGLADLCLQPEEVAAFA